jgi:hypothetical protein
MENFLTNVDKLWLSFICGLYYKHIMIVNDASRVSSECHQNLESLSRELSIGIPTASFTYIYDVYSKDITHGYSQLTIVTCL